MRVHLCILSQQVLQNILPLRCIKADRVCLVASEEMSRTGKGKAFARLLLDLDIIKSEENIIHLPVMPSSNYQEMRDWAQKQIQVLHRDMPEATFYLNSTGGTKLMSLAMIEACLGALKDKVEVIYCDTFNDQLETIFPKYHLFKLPPNLLSAEDILKAHSIKIKSAESESTEWQDKVNKRASLTRYLGQHLGPKVIKFIEAMNEELSSTSKKSIKGSESAYMITLDATLNPLRDHLLKLMAHLKLITLNGELQRDKPVKVTIRSSEVRRYLQGVWLEEYLWLCFKEAEIDDVHSGVKISSLHDDKEFKDNELDLIACYRNNLVIVECKTAVLNQQKLNASLDKLTSVVVRSGGLLAERWFATARWINEQASDIKNEPAEKIRLLAQDQRVILIEPRHLTDLVERIKEWKRSAVFPKDFH
ncbi:hypothetical protein AAEX37_02003 [Oligella sp. MSHR50489EDL]|uniref:Card1-like endonuclease domain-containing protein n=1 Tax=Oligella sp. MSHR50489EDL TaxID=3139409 RepID=UPI003D816D90